MCIYVYHRSIILYTHNDNAPHNPTTTSLPSIPSKTRFFTTGMCVCVWNIYKVYYTTCVYTYNSHVIIYIYIYTRKSFATRTRHSKKRAFGFDPIARGTVSNTGTTRHRKPVRAFKAHNGDCIAQLSEALEAHGANINNDIYVSCLYWRFINAGKWRWLTIIPDGDTKIKHEPLNVLFLKIILWWKLWDMLCMTYRVNVI